MIAIGSDHGGYALKQSVVKYLEEKGYEVKDFGTNSLDSCDYPIFGRAVAKAVANGECEKGIVICTTGIGISITANKVAGIRCALCSDTLSAKMTRLHNDANVLAMGAFYVAPQTACDIADAYLSNELGSGWEWWHNFYEFHKLAIDELEAFDYEEYKKNGFKVNKLGDYDLTLDFDKKPE